jgi:two-component system sensor histidine kinase ArlS
MKIRTKLTRLFTFISASILLGFASVVYFAAKENREKEFYALLEREAVTKANLFFSARVDSITLQDIYRNNREVLNEVEVAIYDSTFNLLYHDAVDIDFVKESKTMIEEILQLGRIQFTQEHWQVIGMQHEFEGSTYAITAAAFDEYGYSKLNSLLRNSIASFMASIVFIFWAGHVFSRKAFEPVVHMINEVKGISAVNLNLRLDTGSGGDELTELATTFNEMLNRLEHSFESQKQFVYNISHELRTPLAAIIAELELSNSRERAVDEYKKAIRSTLEDAQKLVRLSNSLFDLAKASYDSSEISFRTVRIDEVLIDACAQVQQGNPGASVHIHMNDESDDDRLVSVYGNAYLLQVAFVNLLDNACKFSENKQCAVDVSSSDKQVRLRFSDVGVGIPAEDVPFIFNPFFRGKNGTTSEGNGIGLSLTQKIIHLHKGNIQLESSPGVGSTFIVVLPHL